MDKYGNPVCCFLLLYCKEGCWSVRSIATTHEAKYMSRDLNMYCCCWTEVCAAFTVPRDRRVGTTTERLLLVWLLCSTVLNQGISRHMFLISKSLFCAPQPFLKVCHCYLVPSLTAICLGQEENLEVPLSVDIFSHQFCDASVDRFKGHNCYQQEFVPSGWWV